jgi:hypothetical protein
MLVFNFVLQRPSYSNAQRTMTLIFICKLTTLTAFTINITSLILLHYPTGPKGYEALDQYITYSYFRTMLTNQTMIIMTIYTQETSRCFQVPKRRIAI